MFKGSKNAFTLAEVLITLGIIGVVAAMTMPTLLTNTQQQQFRAQLKKSMTVLSQAASVNLAIDDYDASTAGTGAAGTNTATQGSLYALYKNRTNVTSTGTTAVGAWKTSTKLNGGTGLTASGNILNYNDGSSFYFHTNQGSCSYTGTDGSPQNVLNGNITGNTSVAATKVAGMCVGFIDVNGPKAPNTLVKCDTGSTRTNCVVRQAYDVFPVLIDGSNMYPGSIAAEAFYKNQK